MPGAGHLPPSGKMIIETEERVLYTMRMSVRIEYRTVREV